MQNKFWFLPQWVIIITRYRFNPFGLPQGEDIQVSYLTIYLFTIFEIPMKQTFTLFVLCISNLLSAQNWSPMSPDGGLINCSVATDSGVLIGTDAGIFITQDDGKSLHPWSRDIQTGRVADMKWYGGKLFAVIDQLGIFSSTDIGKTWRAGPAGIFLHLGAYGSGQINVNNQGIFIEKSRDSFIYSTDTGKTWKYKALDMIANFDLFSSDNSLFIYNYHSNIGSEQGFYRSNNLGHTWTKCIGTDEYDPRICTFKGHLYLLGKYIYESTDSGTNWVKVTTDSLATSMGYLAPEWHGTDTSGIYAQNGGNALLSMGYWKPGMKGWKLVMNGASNSGNAQNFISLQHGILLSRIENCYYNVNGGDWSTYTKPGLCNMLVKSITTDANSCYAINSVNFFTTHEWDSKMDVKFMNFTSEDEGAEKVVKTRSGWLIGKYGFGGSMQFYFSPNLRDFYKVTNFSNSPYDAQIYSEYDSIWLYSYGSPVKIETFDDSGHFQNLINQGAYGNAYNYYASGLARFNGTMYAIINSDYKTGSSVLRKYNYPYWSQVAELIDGNYFQARALTVWNGKLYMGMANGKGVLASSNGTIWTDFSTGLNNVSPQYFFAVGDSLFLGSPQGLYIRTKTSSGWVRITGNLPCNDVQQIGATERYIWVALKGGSLWRILRENRTAGNTAQHMKPMRVYPNPASNKVHIQLADNANISEVVLYNLQGVEIAKFVVKNTAVNQTAFAIPTGTRAGIYLVQVKDSEGHLYQNRLVVEGQ